MARARTEIELGAWRDRAACAASGKPTGDWFPETSRPWLVDRHIEAQAICRRCPVRVECLSWAIASREPEGLWGGLYTADRNRVAVEAGLAAATQLRARPVVGHCPQGHDYDSPDDYWLDRAGRRRCIRCRASRAAEREQQAG